MRLPPLEWLAHVLAREDDLLDDDDERRGDRDRDQRAEHAAESAAGHRRDHDEGARDRIDRARRRSSSVALLLIRIDGLAEINTAFGRGTGDAALQTVATVLRDVT